MNKRQRWFDCNGVELHPGDIVRDIHSGNEEKVYECYAEYCPEQLNLGLNASNERFLELHPNWRREIYPFDNFAYTVVDGKRCLQDYEKVVK